MCFLEEPVVRRRGRCPGLYQAHRITRRYRAEVEKADVADAPSSSLADFIGANVRAT